MGKRSRPGLLPHGLVILHEDRDILVVDKPAGLLTIGTESDKSRTAYFILTDYVRKGCARSRNRVFIVHRLDRETSGVLVFAKSEEAKLRLQGEWGETEKKYLAVVHGQCRKSEETITTYLAENKAHVMYSTSDPAKGKLSHTAYRVLKQTKDFALLEVNSADGQEEPDPGASRRYRTPHRGRQEVWQREGIPRRSRTSRQVDLLQAPLQWPAADFCRESARVFPQAGWRYHASTSRKQHLFQGETNRVKWLSPRYRRACIWRSRANR